MEQKKCSELLGFPCGVIRATIVWAKHVPAVYLQHCSLLTYEIRSLLAWKLLGWRGWPVIPRTTCPWFLLLWLWICSNTWPYNPMVCLGLNSGTHITEWAISVSQSVYLMAWFLWWRDICIWRHLDSTFPVTIYFMLVGNCLEHACHQQSIIRLRRDSL